MKRTAISAVRIVDAQYIQSRERMRRDAAKAQCSLSRRSGKGQIEGPAFTAIGFNNANIAPMLIRKGVLVIAFEWDGGERGSWRSRIQEVKEDAGRHVSDRRPQADGAAWSSTPASSKIDGDLPQLLVNIQSCNLAIRPNIVFSFLVAVPLLAAKHEVGDSRFRFRACL